MLVSTRDRLPLWRLAYRLGGVLRGHISLAADRRDDVGGRGREMEEEGDLDDWCQIADIFNSKVQG